MHRHRTSAGARDSVKTRSFFIGLAGPSGSGKTQLATALQNRLGTDICGVMHLDSYYRDLGHLPEDQREKSDFDQPAALDSGRMQADLQRLKNGSPIEVPVYDFVTHCRRPETETFAATPVVIIEGLFVFCFAELTRLLDLRAYVDVDAEVCLDRRLARDVHDRGRDEAGVRAQFDQWVRPSISKWVLPQRVQAELILDGTRPPDELVARILPGIPLRSL